MEVERPAPVRLDELVPSSTNRAVDRARKNGSAFRSGQVLSLEVVAFTVSNPYRAGGGAAGSASSGRGTATSRGRRSAQNEALARAEARAARKQAAKEWAAQCALGQLRWAHSEEYLAVLPAEQSNEVVREELAILGCPPLDLPCPTEHELAARDDVWTDSAASEPGRSCAQPNRAAPRQWLPPAVSAFANFVSQCGPICRIGVSRFAEFGLVQRPRWVNQARPRRSFFGATAPGNGSSNSVKGSRPTAAWPTA